MRLNRKLITYAALAAFAGSLPNAALAATEIEWWHAFTGRLGDILAKQVEDFNASQSDYKIVAV